MAQAPWLLSGRKARGPAWLLQLAQSSPGLQASALAGRSRIPGYPLSAASPQHEDINIIQCAKAIHLRESTVPQRAGKGLGVDKGISASRHTCSGLVAPVITVETSLFFTHQASASCARLQPSSCTYKLLSLSQHNCRWQQQRMLTRWCYVSIALQPN